MADIFYADLNRTIIPIAADASEKVASWIIEPPADSQEQFAGRLKELFVLVFAITDPAFLLRTSTHQENEPPYPIGDELISEEEAKAALDAAPVDLSTSLEEITSRLSYSITNKDGRPSTLGVVDDMGIWIEAPDNSAIPERIAASGPYQISPCQKWLLIKTEAGGKSVKLTPKERASIMPLLERPGEWVNLAERRDVPVGTYPNHLGNLIRKISEAKAPNHIERPGTGLGSKYRISLTPLVSPVPPVSLS